ARAGWRRVPSGRRSAGHDIAGAATNDARAAPRARRYRERSARLARCASEREENPAVHWDAFLRDRRRSRSALHRLLQALDAPTRPGRVPWARRERARTRGPADRRGWGAGATKLRRASSPRARRAQRCIGSRLCATAPRWPRGLGIESNRPASRLLELFGG